MISVEKGEVKEERFKLVADQSGTFSGWLSRAEATELFESLGRALGRPILFSSVCDNRYSHGSHTWIGADERRYICNGMAYDRT